MFLSWNGSCKTEPTSPGASSWEQLGVRSGMHSWELVPQAWLRGLRHISQGNSSILSITLAWSEPGLITKGIPQPGSLQALMWNTTLYGIIKHRCCKQKGPYKYQIQCLMIQIPAVSLAGQRDLPSLPVHGCKSHAPRFLLDESLCVLTQLLASCPDHYLAQPTGLES